MYRIVLMAAMLFSEAAAQDLSFKWSEKVPAKGVLNYCGMAANHIYTSQSQGPETVLLRRFDSSLVLINEDTLALSNKREDYLVSFVTESHWIHVIAQKESKRQTNIILIKTSLQNPQQTTISVAAVLKDGYKGFVYAYFSSDRSKLLITNFSFKAATQTTRRDFAVINCTSGMVQFSGSMLLEGSNEGLGVANNGMVWCYFLQNSAKKTRLFEQPKIQHKIYFITPDNVKNEFTVRFDGEYAPGLDIVQGEGSDLYVAGFAYDNNIKTTKLSGSELFIYKADSEKGIITDSVFTNFTGLYPERKLKEEDRLPYTIKHIYKRNNGGFTVLAEQYQLIIGQYGTTQKYNDIACIQLYKDFTFQSIGRIPKMQFGTDNPSFISTLLGDTIYLVYNDLRENISTDDENIRYPSNKQNKNALFLATVDTQGRYNKEVVYDYAAGEPMPQILSGFMLKNHSIIMPAEGQIAIATITSN